MRPRLTSPWKLDVDSDKINCYSDLIVRAHTVTVQNDSFTHVPVWNRVVITRRPEACSGLAEVQSLAQ